MDGVFQITVSYLLHSEGINKQNIKLFPKNTKISIT